MTDGNMLYLALVLFSFLAFSGLVFYASTQTLEAENDPNMPTGKTNSAWPYGWRRIDDWRVLASGGQDFLYEMRKGRAVPYRQAAGALRFCHGDAGSAAPPNQMPTAS